MPARHSLPRGTPTGSSYASQGVYRRDFTNTLVFVNPSSTTSHKITTPANPYKSLYGALEGRTITLAPRKRNRTSTHLTTSAHLHH